MKSVICVSYCKPGLGDLPAPLTKQISNALNNKIDHAIFDVYLINIVSVGATASRNCVRDRESGVRSAERQWEPGDGTWEWSRQQWTANSELSPRVYALMIQL